MMSLKSLNVSQTPRMMPVLIMGTAALLTFSIQLNAQQLWTPVFADLQNVLFDISCADSSYCLIAGTVNWTQGMLVLKSEDGGRSFQVAHSDTRLIATHFYDIQAVDRSYAYMKADSGYIYVSRNGAETWERRGPFRNNGGMSEILMIDSTTGCLIVQGSVDSLFWSDDGFDTWKSEPFVDPWPGESSGVMGLFADRNGVQSAVFNKRRHYVLGYARESDVWDYVDIPSDSLPMWSAVYRNENEVWCWFRRTIVPGRTWYGNRVIRTTDRGETWETVLDTVLADSVMIEQIAFGPGNEILMATGSGPVRSTDDGRTWVLERIYDIPQFSSHHVEYPVGTKGIFFSSGINDPTVFLPDEESSVRQHDRQSDLTGNCADQLSFRVGPGRVAGEIEVSFLPQTTGRYRIEVYGLRGEWISQVTIDGIDAVSVRRHLPTGGGSGGPLLVVVEGPCGRQGRVIPQQFLYH